MSAFCRHVNDRACGFYSCQISVRAKFEHIFPVGPFHDPVTLYGINYAGTQVTQRDFQNKGMLGWTGTSSFVLELPRRYRSFSLSRSKKINRKPFSGQSQEIVILLKISKEDTSPSFRSVRSPKPQIFVEMFRRNLQSSVWKRHVGGHNMCTNMAAGK